MEETIYMNLKTGSTGTRSEWWYKNEKGEEVNGVDLGEVVPVVWDKEKQRWLKKGDKK